MSTTEHKSAHADDHGASGPPSAETIARGHEVDSYDALSVFSVPLLVVLFFVLAFGTVSMIFYFIFPSTVDPQANPQAVERNNAPIAERLGRIYRGSKDVDQPRLEPLKIRTGKSRAITSPESATGNSPELHPEDIIPSVKNTPALYRSGWSDANKTVAHITIDDAAELLLQKGLLPVSKTPSAPQTTAHLPSAANAGQGSGPSRAVPPPVSPAPVGGKN